MERLFLGGAEALDHPGLRHIERAWEEAWAGMERDFLSSEGEDNANGKKRSWWRAKQKPRPWVVRLLRHSRDEAGPSAKGRLDFPKTS